MSAPNWTARFETVGELYRRETGYLRPGKDEPAATGRDSCSDENRARFDEWLVMHGWYAAIDRIAELEARVADLETSLDEASSELEEYHPDRNGRQR